MKVALYIEDGVTQVVLTPETNAEKRVMALVDEANDLRAYRGQFYACQGGWVRQSEIAGAYNLQELSESVILVCRRGPEEPT